MFGVLSSCTQNLFVSKKPLVAPSSLAVGPDYQYRLRKDDKVSLSVWDHEELSVGSIYTHFTANEVEGKWTLVDPAGFLSVPKLGSYPVEGLTVLEAESQIAKALSKWVVNPQLTLKVLNLEATVLGEVVQPGKQHLEKQRNTLVEVLGRAGDFGPYADKRHVKVLRMVGTNTKATEIDLTTLDGFERNNLVILPGDVVFVPAKNGKQFDRKAPSVIGVASVISTIIIITRLFL